ncbi:MAG: hypothetical protein NZM26_02835, partial [Patescibacteria group bacterium]|nr:hypothetical protein [Patescibacteria group bacterium]
MLAFKNSRKKVYIAIALFILIIILIISLPWTKFTNLFLAGEDLMRLPSEITNQNQSSKKTYQNKMLKISFQYPLDWELEEKLEVNEISLC